MSVLFSGIDLKEHRETMINTKKIFIMLVLFGFMAWTPGAFPDTAGRDVYVQHMKAGAGQIKSGDYQAARESFKQALQYDDADFSAHLGLGIAYYQLGDDRLAEQELNRAAEINPKEATAYQFLGELYYRKDDLKTAALYWGKAVALNPSETVLRARLDRIRKEHKAEKTFNREVTRHFLTKYEGRERIETGKIVLRILEDAYGVVGRALSLYPDHEIQVILYSGQQFQDITDAPGWSSGIYDGKIRIPIGGIERETPGLRKLLYHEYTHAVVRAITPRCPTWLNEGLAQYFEGRRINSQQRAVLKHIVQSGKLPPLQNLEGSFMGLGGSQAEHAYVFSLSAVHYMIETFGMNRVRGVLDELARGADTSRALSRGIMLSSEEFERRWKQSLE
jgi:tetratricopeptide (TPR) repeat protein